MYQLRLKELRIKAGFKTQKEIADRLGIKWRKYASWERQEVALTLEDAYTIALVLGCTPNDICGWPEGLNSKNEIHGREERDLVECFRQSTDQQKDALLIVARNAAGMSKEGAERDAAGSASA